MEYRLYKPDDFAVLYGIEEICFHPPFRFGRRYLQWLVNAPNSATWIVEQSGTMAGFGIVEWTPSVRGLSAYIQTIEVLPDYRGRGAGCELLTRLQNAARDAGAVTVWLHVACRRRPDRRELRLQLTTGWEMISASLLPLAVLDVSRLLRAPLTTAILLALCCSTVVLGVAGWEMGRDGRLSTGERLVSTATAAAFGAALIVLKMLLH